MIVKEYHINKNRVHDIWNDCERFQQNGNHFLEELKKVQSISSVPPSENNPQEKENNHPISGSLDPFHESIEINAQEKQKKKKKLPKRSLQDQLLTYELVDPMQPYFFPRLSRFDKYVFVTCYIFLLVHLKL